MVMPIAKTFDSADLDLMVEKLLLGSHNEWFFRQAVNGKPVDDILKNLLTRSTQIARAHHRFEPMLNWFKPSDPTIVFMAAMVFSNSDEETRTIQGTDLYRAISEYWLPDAINKAFTWMRGHDAETWQRCCQAIKRENGLLEKKPFRLIDHISEELQQTLELCSSLGILPSPTILRQKSLNLENTIGDIGLLLL
jgi:hypothetical protein